MSTSRLSGHHRYARFVLVPRPISTPRLLLVPLLEETLDALLVGDRHAAQALQDLEFTAEFADSLGYEFLKAQLRGMRRRGVQSGWFVRAILRKEDGAVVGDCGFHGSPDDVGRAEIGYRILPEFRANGFATEAASGLVGWAREHGVPSVYAAVKVTNVASQRVLDEAGFALIDSPSSERAGADEMVFKIDI